MPDLRSHLFQSFHTTVRLSRGRTGPQGFDHLIDKNYGSGLCQLEVEDLVAAFDDLARVELALRRNSKMQKKKITPEQNDPQQQDGYRKDHPKDKLKEHAKETEQGVGRVGEQGRRRGGGGARIWERRKTEGGGLRAEGLVKGLATGRFARQLAQGLHFALGMLQHCELLPGDVEQIAVMKLLRGSGQGFLRSLVRHHARGVKERV